MRALNGPGQADLVNRIEEERQMARTNEATATERPQLEFAHVNGVRIAYEVSGDSDIPLVLVHGAWGTLRNWDGVVPGLARHVRVAAYDRRGHSNSDCPPGQDSYRQDVDDLAALTEHLDIAPAWVMGLSSGAFIALLLAATWPELVRGIILHEPPMWSLLDEGGPEAEGLQAMAPTLAGILDRIAAGDPAGAAEQFTDDFLLGPGGWAGLPDDVREGMITNAPTVPGELNNPEPWSIDEDAIAGYCGPVLLTSGDQSPPVHTAVMGRLVELLPQAEHVICRGAGHLPHVTHPDEYARHVLAFLMTSQQAG